MRWTKGTNGVSYTAYHPERFSVSVFDLQGPLFMTCWISYLDVRHVKILFTDVCSFQHDYHLATTLH